MKSSFNLRYNSRNISFFVSPLFHFLRKNSFEFGKLFVVIFDAGIHGTIEFVDLTITLLEQKDESEAELSYWLSCKSERLYFRSRI